MSVKKPKYQQLKDYIISAINANELKVGDKIYSENELAEKFEMSRHTVRQALGELVNEGWLYKIQGKGTFVDEKHNKTTSKSKVVAVITTYLSDYIFPSIIRGIDTVLSENGYNIHLSCTYNQHEKERLCLENLLNQNVSAIIVEPTKSALPNPNIDMYKNFINLNIPILFIHGCYKELNCSYIVEDDTEAGFLAAKHLIELGHKNIGGIFKIDDIQGHMRFAGFQKALYENSIKISDSRILWFETSDIDDNFKSKYTYFEKILSDCTAIVFYNDQTTIKFMDIIREKNLNVPEDISIVSFDDSQLAVASEIKLTTVAHPKEALGKEAAKAIINMIKKNQDYYNIKMKPKLIIRKSTKELTSNI